MNKEELLLQKRLVELSNTAYQRDIVTFTDFLNLNELNILHSTPKHMFPAAYETYGGYEAAERQMVAFLPDALYYEYRYPVEILKISPVNLKFAENLSHRDYLGALMSLGIRRECIGDILLSEDGAYLFVLDTVAPLVCDELSSVGRCSVCVRAGRAEELPGREERPAQTATVASLRLDAVLAAMLHISRGDAVQLVKSGMVEVNHVSTVSAHYEVFENDVFSIRGRGKYKLCGVGAKSRKGRTFVSYIEY